MEILKKIWDYITLKKDDNAKDNANLKMMHGMNKISLFMFFVAILVIIIKCSR